MTLYGYGFETDGPPILAGQTTEPGPVPVAGIPESCTLSLLALGAVGLAALRWRQRAATSLSRKVKAVWNILSQKGLKTHVINWFAGHPAEPINGVCVSDILARTAMRSKEKAPAIGARVVHPPELASKMAELLVRPQDIDSPTMGLFVPDFKKVDQTNDHRLELIARQLAECLTVHAAVTWAMERELWDFSAVYYGEIDHFCHGFMRYHPPRLPWVNEREYELYNGVVNSVYRLHDLLLGRLLQLAGEEATVIVCSDHGWHAGELRLRRPPPIPAGLAEEHRPIGILAIRGPGIKQDELVYGAGVLDLTPTLLTLFGLPVGRDMDGRVLAEAFEAAVTVETIPSWEEVPGRAGMHPPGTVMSRDDSQALIRPVCGVGLRGDVARRPGSFRGDDAAGDSVDAHAGVFLQRAVREGAAAARGGVRPEPAADGNRSAVGGVPVRPRSQK